MKLRCDVRFVSDRASTNQSIKDTIQTSKSKTNVQIGLITREWAYHSLDDVKLVDLGLSREQRLAVHQLRHDASDGPDVDTIIIIC